APTHLPIALFILAVGAPSTCVRKSPVRRRGFFYARNPAAGCTKPGFPFSGSVIADGGCHIWCVSRAAYAVAQSATLQLNSRKMAVPGRNYMAGMKFSRRTARQMVETYGIEARWIWRSPG